MHDADQIRENGATTGVGVLATYAYDDLGNRTSLTFGNAVVQTYALDPLSRLQTLTTNVAGTTNDLTIGGGATPISYNAASEITGAPRSNDKYSWTGAAAVNRNYTVNGLNQYTAAGSASFTYDAKGNLTSDGTNSFCYSSENLLTGMNGSCAGPTLSLAYDPFTRLYQVAGTTTIRFAYDGLNLIADYNQSDVLQHRYVFGPGIDEPLVEYAGAGTTSRTFLSSDERGSIIARTTNTGLLNAINTYDEYGIPGSSNAGLFQYTGQAWISQLGMYYYKARIYSPTLGRFLQTDPIGYADNANLYSYVHDDPVNYVDPFGLIACTEICITAARLPKSICGGGLSGSCDRKSGSLAAIPGLPSPAEQSATCKGRPFSRVLSNPNVKKRINEAIEKSLETPNQGLPQRNGPDKPANGSEHGFNVHIGPLGDVTVGSPYTDRMELRVDVQEPLIPPVLYDFVFVHVHQSPEGHQSLSPGDFDTGVNIIAVTPEGNVFCAEAQ